MSETDRSRHLSDCVEQVGYGYLGPPTYEPLGFEGGFYATSICPANSVEGVGISVGVKGAAGVVEDAFLRRAEGGHVEVELVDGVGQDAAG